MDENFLYFLDSESKFDPETSHWKKKLVLCKTKILKETNQSYYVLKNEYEKNWLKEDNNLKKHCFLVKKDTMCAIISQYGVTHRQYYHSKEQVVDAVFCANNAYKIGQAVEKSNNAYVLRQLAHVLEIPNLYEPDFKEIKEI